MATFGGGGLASVLASWQSPVNVAATVLPGIVDAVVVRPTMTLQVDDNFTWRALTVGVDANTVLVIDADKLLTILETSNVQNECNIGARAVLECQGRLLTNGACFLGAGTVRMSGANANATLGGAINFNPAFVLVNGSRATLTAEITFPEVSIADGCTLTLGLGAVLHAGSLANQGSIVVDCGAGNTVTIDAPITGNQPTVVSGSWIAGPNSMPGGD